MSIMPIHENGWDIRNNGMLVRRVRIIDVTIAIGVRDS